MKKPELLAPAGSMEALKQAVHHGADAVYLGGTDFGARAFAENFSPEALQEAVAYAHLYGKKVYVTVNTLIGQPRWDDFIRTISFLNDVGADAVILQDIGAAKVVHALFPDLPWHASTQMHNHNASSAGFAQALGAERVVLAREMRLADIKALKSIGVQTEVFIHGALCVSYSGQCLFSALTQGRSGNQGACAQVCRMRYVLLETQDGQTITRLTDGDFLLSPKDLGVLNRIGEMMDAGIDSFKIEGRMKSPEYVGYVTALYRRLIDDYAENGKSALSETEMDTLARLFNRGFTQGLVLDAFGSEMMRPDRPNHMGVKIGQVTKTSKEKITIQLSAPLHQGDGIKFENADSGMIAEMIYQNGLLVSGAKNGDVIQLDNKPNLTAPDTVLVTQDKRLTERLAAFEPIRVPVDVSVSAKIGQALSVTVSDGVHTLTETGEPVQAAKSAPTDADAVRAQISRLGDTAFDLREFSFSGENVFVPKSELNGLRRALTDQLTKARKLPAERRALSLDLPRLFDFSAFRPLDEGFSVLVRNAAQFDAARDFPFVRVYTDDAELYQSHADDARLFFMLPRAGEKTLPSAERVLATENGGLSYPSLTKAAGTTLNVQNASSLALLMEKGVGLVTLSPELTDTQTALMTKAFTETFGFIPPLEAVVYGRFELMLTKNCIIASALKTEKNCGKCRHADYALRDIRGAVYPIKTDDNCHNHIFAAESTDRIRDIQSLKNIGISRFRLSLLDESPAECRALFSRVFSL